MALEKVFKIPSLVRKAGQSASKAQPFYSNVDQAIANITQGTGTGAQMLAELLKTKGVAKELKDRPAIKKTLEANKDAKVTKADLERLAAENPPPQVQEKSPSLPFDENNPSLPSNNSLVLGPNPHYPHGRPDLPIGVFERETGELITAGQTERDAILDAFSEMPEFWNGAAETTSAFRKYTIPGGENYREILLRLPVEKASAKDQQRLLEIQERIRELSPIILKQPVGDTAERKEFHDLTHEKLRINRLIKGEEGYNSPHFEEPNVLAHARVADRVGPNGEKILHVEEVQSDWHQAGRKKGYRGENAKKAEDEFKSYSRDLASKYGLNPEQNLAMYATMKRMQPDEVAKYEELQSAWANSKGGVPDAPFKQNWHELVMKRLLDDAARNGYDKVVITPGAEQAKRYDLSKQISRVVYSPTTETLNAFDNSGKSVLMKSGITPERVEDYIGKEPAKRLLDPQNTKSYLRGGKEDSYHEITGEDLRVGGEGMIGFYDQILPSYLNDYGKRYGAQVGTYNLPDPNVHHIPTMADIQRGGMEMFGRADLTPEETLQVENAFRAQRNAETAIPLHSFDITPQMREDITTKGVPLYQAAPPVAIGAGAMQEEQPAEYAGGGIIKKAAKALSKVEALRLTKERELIEPTDYLSARAIEPPHEVRDTEKLNLLIKSMKENGWQGRPILTYDAGRGDEALTGSHRIKAATQANIEVPIYRIENAGDYVDKNGKSIFDVGFMEPEDQVKWLNQFGDKNAAKLLEQEPELKSTKYAGGGIIKKAGQIIGKAAQSSGMARPVTATKDLTTLQDFHTSLGDRIRERVAERQNLIESMPFKYDKGQRVFTEDSARKNRLPYEILDRTLYGNNPMRADHPVLGPGMGAVIKDPETGKAIRTPYEAGYRVRSEGPEGWQEYVLPETAIKGDVEMAGGGAVRKALKAVLPKGQQDILSASESAANLDKFLAESAVKDRMYHATSRGGFSTFDRNKTTEWRQPSMDTVGSWFSDNPSEVGGAGMYASGQGASIYPVHLSIKNPKVYNTFNDFLRDMHGAAGREMPKSAPGLGSTEELRQKLKAEGYDGIAFNQTANQSLMQDIQEMQDAVKRARMEELSMKRQEREPYTMKRERLEQTLNSMNKELSQSGSSTEFDEQRVFIPLEPTQIKSAIGNRGTYDPAEADITKAKGGRVTNDAMWMAVQNKQLRKKHGN